MDFGLSSEQIEIQGLARAFALKEMAPFAAKWDEECIFPSQTLKQAAQLGFGGIYCSEDWGGSGLGRLEATIIFEELSTACPSTAAYLSIHNMASWMIDHFGNDDQRRRWVPDLCSMEIMSSYCLTEPGAGSDAAALRTQARRDGSDYVINGSKAFISGGSVSDLYVCMIRTGDDATQGISCIAVEKEALGLSFGKQEKKMGWHSQPTSAAPPTCSPPTCNFSSPPGSPQAPGSATTSSTGRTTKIYSSSKTRSGLTPDKAASSSPSPPTPTTPSPARSSTPTSSSTP